MVQAVFNILLFLLLVALGSAAVYVIIKMIFVLFKYKPAGFWKGLLKTKFIKPFDFVKWVTYDIIRGKDFHKLFGIWAFTGYYGQGKTMGCVTFAKKLQKDYPHKNIKIFSNIDVVGQERRIESWEEILDLPKNSIMIYDESQADWNCNNRDFPDDLLRQLTQQRKKQLALFMTSPVYNRMNINIRESVNFVIVCKNILSLDRWFKYTFYRAEDYEMYRENKIKLMMNKHFDLSFIATDEVYSTYDTVEQVETIKVIKPRDKEKLLQEQMKKLNYQIKSVQNNK